MDIPEEAWAAADDFGLTRGAVEAVAPHIRRAAQVEILREMYEKLRELGSGEGGLLLPGYMAGLRAAGGICASKAIEIERGEEARTDG